MQSWEFSQLFEGAQRGNLSARDAVYKAAFSRLRSIAAALLQRERNGHTLQPTALVSELFLKLDGLRTRILDEDHFFRVSARAMRQVLIDHARVKGAAKRIVPEALPGLLAAQSGQADLESRLAVRMVFERLRRLDPKAADTVWLRAVEGLTLAELSRARRCEIWRVRADYDFGLRWMADQLRRQSRSKRPATSAAQSPASEGLSCGLGS